MKNSFVSEVDMSFAIITEDYLKEEFHFHKIQIEEEMEHFNWNKYIKAYDRPGLAANAKKNYNVKVKKSKVKNQNLLEVNQRQTNHIAENMILSHLSTKRKEFSIKRFDKIFLRFDKYLESFY